MLPTNNKLSLYFNALSITLLLKLKLTDYRFSSLSPKSGMAELETTASAGKFRYRRLRYSDEFEEAFGRSRSRSRWSRLRNRASSSSIGRRLKKLKIPSLRKLSRRKSRLVKAMRGSICKVVKRFRDGEAYLGDLFAGNYLFLQVNPSSIKSLKNQLPLQKFLPPSLNL